MITAADVLDRGEKSADWMLLQVQSSVQHPSVPVPTRITASGGYVDITPK